jgi:hypothetical protein
MGIIMKPLSLALLLSLAATGMACSESVASRAYAEPQITQTPVAETANAETNVSSRLNLGLGQEPRGRDRLLDASGSADFGDLPDLGIVIETDPASTVIDLSGDLAPPAEKEDDLIRVP